MNQIQTEMFPVLDGFINVLWYVEKILWYCVQQTFTFYVCTYSQNMGLFVFAYGLFFYDTRLHVPYYDMVTWGCSCVTLCHNMMTLRITCRMTWAVPIVLSIKRRGISKVWIILPKLQMIKHAKLQCWNLQIQCWRRGEAGPSYKGLSKIETDLRLYCVTDESLCQL